MENASKALIMAGGILIALLIISLLVMFYDDIQETMNSQSKSDLVEQIAEFNKQYDVYYRDNLHGNDILSLANMVNDYNKREAKEKSYKKLEMGVTFASKTSIRKDGEKLTTVINKGERWDSNNIQNLIENKTDGWKTVIEKMEEEKKIKGYTIQYLSGIRLKQLEDIFKNEISIKPKFIEEDVQPLINKYLSYRSALSSMKSKTFKATKFEYDEKTGRIIKMEFIEI